MKKHYKVLFSAAVITVMWLCNVKGSYDFPDGIVVQDGLEDIPVPEGKEVILDVYTVQKCDWLIKIAERKYDNKYLWRLIYRFNDFINDPHWIFPGDELIIPRVVDKIPEPRITKKVEENEVNSDVAENTNYDERKYFLASEDFSFDATVSEFKQEKRLQAYSDYFFIDLGSHDGIEKRQEFNIYRRTRQAIHPKTGDEMGFIYRKIGEAKVTGDIQTRNSTARITASSIPIEEGI